MSPKSYVTQRDEYNNAISSGRYTSFLDYLVYYNQLDCDLLAQAMTKFLETFDFCFDVSLLSKLSLPGISEQIMWHLYDKKTPRMFSFDAKFGKLNQQIRSKLQGGPTIIFHRHAEIKRRGSFHESVFNTPNGDPYKRIVSLDFNALYAWAMKQE